MRTTETRRVWIGCLACYNAGNLRGDWYDADAAGDVTPEELHGGATHHKNLWCMDTDGFPAPWAKEMGPTEAHDIDAALAKVEDDGADVGAFAAWVKHGNGEIDDVDGFRDAYCGEHESEEAYAEELAEELGLIPLGAKWPLNCIDWEAAAREKFCGDYWSESVAGGRAVYVFRSC